MEAPRGGAKYLDIVFEDANYLVINKVLIVCVCFFLYALSFALFFLSYLNLVSLAM